MRVRFIAVWFTVVMAAMIAVAQDAPATPPQGPPPDAGSQRGMGQGRGRGWGSNMMGRGVVGVVTEVASDHYTVKNDLGETYAVNYSANTHVLKQPPRRNAPGEAMNTPPEEIKASDIKVGDAIMARGEVDPTAKTVGAILVVKIDPERAREMREMEANFGKTWLAGKVKAVQDTKVTIESPVDNAEHTFVADENTSFRKRREPVTLADVEVGANVRVEGAVKEGVFVASSVTLMGPPATGGPARREGPPPQ